MYEKRKPKIFSKKIVSVCSTWQAFSKELQIPILDQNIVNFALYKKRVGYDPKFTIAYDVTYS